jgi:hypothetical protein
LPGNHLDRILRGRRCCGRLTVTVHRWLKNAQFHQKGFGLFPIAKHLFSQLKWRPLSAAGIALGHTFILVQAKSIARLACDARTGQIMALTLDNRNA